MQNYKKLLFAGLAIVPMALSSWTSTGNDIKYGNGDQNQVASIDLIGDTAASSVVTSKTKKHVFSVSSIEQTNVAETKVAIVTTPTNPTLSFEDMVKNYK
ncbi:hypothetical protein [Chryseobacterium sp. SIMBA_038]|uniref:hypothetical protein n=1 Tax=Chryseobacterium sp. SIMBA_038 TaxID=3085780 RepID=UPI00397B119A